MLGLTAQINTSLDQSSVSKLKNDLQNQINSINGRINISANSSQLEKLNLQLKNLRNSSLQVDRIMRDLDRTVGRVDQSIADTANGIIKMRQNTSDLTKIFNQADTALEAFSQQAGLAARRFLAFSVAYAGINGLAGAIKGAVTEAITFDKELVRIGQVSEDSFDKVRNLGKEVSRLSINLGVNSGELLKSAVLLKQAGLSVKDTTVALEALAKASLAPNFDSLTETTDGLIAVMQQFKVEAKDFESVLGSMNSVAGAFAVEAGDLTKVVQKAGGVFASIKGDTKSGRDALNELLALFTSVRATTRESADEIGTGLRTIFGRLQRSETVEALKALGVQVRYTKEEIDSAGLDRSLEGQFVGGYEAIRRISQALNQIPSTDARFAAITEQIGGLRQLSRVTPLVKEFAKSQEALAVAQAGSNSLAINAQQAQESLANKIDKVREKWLELGRTVADSTGFRSLFSDVSLLSDGLVSLLKNVTPLIPVLGVFAAGKIVTSLGPAIGNSVFKRESYPGFRDNLKAIRENKDNDPRKMYMELFKDVTPLSAVPQANSKQLTDDLRTTIRKRIKELNPNFSDKQVDSATTAELVRIGKDRRESVTLQRQAKSFENTAATNISNANEMRTIREAAEKRVKARIELFGDRDTAIQSLGTGGLKTELQNKISASVPQNQLNKLNASIDRKVVNIKNKANKDIEKILPDKEFTLSEIKNIEDEILKKQSELSKAKTDFKLNPKGYKEVAKPILDRINELNNTKKEIENVNKNIDYQIQQILSDADFKVRKALSGKLSPKAISLMDMIAKGQGAIPQDQKSVAELAQLMKELEYLKDTKDFNEKEKVLRAESEVAVNKSAIASTKAKGIDERQILTTTVDALGRRSVEMSSSTDRLKAQADSIAPQTGSQTIKGFIQAEAERAIVMENIVSEDLKKIRFMKVENAVREQYIKGTQYALQLQNKSMSSEEARILAEEMYETALKNNALILTKNFNRSGTPGAAGQFVAGAKGTIVDASMNAVSDADARKVMLGNLLTKQNIVGASAIGLPILGGLATSQMGTATEAVQSRNTSGFTGAKAFEGAAMFGGGAALLGANPFVIAGAAALGMSNALIQAKGEIAEARLGVAVQELADKFRQISEGIIDLDYDSTKNITSSQEQLAIQAFTSAQSSNIFSTLGYQSGLGKGEGFITAGTEKYRAELSKTSAQAIQLFTKEVEKEIKNSPRRNNESDKEFSNRIFNQALGNNNGFFRSQFGNMAFTEKVDISKINKRGMSQVDAAIKSQTNKINQTKVNEIVNNFGLLADSIISANMELRRFSDAASDFANILNGKADFVKVQNLSDAVKSSSSFNTSVFQNVVDSVNGQLGGNILKQSDIISATRQMLPVIVSTIRASGNISDEGGFSGAITARLGKQLKSKGFSKEDVSVIVSGIATSLANTDMTKMFVDSGNDVTKITDKILEPISKPFIEMLTSVRKELENSANTFIQQLNNIGQAQLKLIDDLNMVDRNKFGLARTEAEIASRTSGKTVSDTLPLPNLSDRVSQRLAGNMDINDPAAIGRAIDTNIGRLSTAQTAINNAMKGGFAQGSEFDKITREFTDLQNETNRYMTVLKQLSDSSQKLAEIQDRINFLKDEEAAKFNQARIELAGTSQQRRELRRGKEIFERIEGGEKISNLSRREAGRLFAFADGAGPRAKNVVDAALRREGKGLDAKDEDEMKKLQNEQKKAQERAVAASEAVALNTQSLSKILENQVISSQNALVAALDRNSRMIEMTRIGTQLGGVSSQLDSLRGPNEALKNISTVFALNPDIARPSNESIISNRSLISNFASTKNKMEIEDFFRWQNGRDNDPNKVASIQKNIVDTAVGSDFFQRRESMIQKMMSQFGFDRATTEGLVPQQDTPNIAGKIFGRTSAFLRDNPLLKSGEFMDARNAMANKGLESLTNLSPAELGNIAKNAESFNKYGITVSELDKKTKDLTTEFNNLSELLKGLNTSSSSGASGTAGAAVAGFGVIAAKPFASGGFIFRQQGMDKIPAMLSPGEAVIPAAKAAAQKEVVQSLITGRRIRSIDNSLAQTLGVYEPTNRRQFAAEGAAIGDLRRFGLTNDFGGDLYATRRKSFNTSAYLSSINQAGRPGVGGQRALEASLMANAVANNVALAIDNYGEAKAKKDYGNVFRNPLRFAEGGVVPGFGFGDKVPSMLTPGEVVLNRKQQSQIAQATQPKVQNLEDSSKKFTDSIKLMDESISRFGKHVDTLDKVLDKKVSIDGEQIVTVNITGIPKEGMSVNIEEVVMNAVQEQLKKSFPGFV